MAGRGKQSRVTAKESLENRRMVLQALSDCYHEGGSGWLDLSEVDITNGKWTVVGALEGLGLLVTKDVETRWKSITLARITQDGLWALENDRLTGSRLKHTLAVPQAVWERLKGIADALEVSGVGELLYGVVGRSAEFERWFRHVYSKEYESEDKKI